MRISIRAGESGRVQAEGLVQRAHRQLHVYFSSMTTEVLISLVVIIWILMPSPLGTWNIVEATLARERMPMPTIDNLQILVSLMTAHAHPARPGDFSQVQRALVQSLRWTVNEKSVLPSCETFCRITSHRCWPGDLAQDAIGDAWFVRHAHHGQFGFRRAG